MNTHEYESEIHEFLWIRYEIHELYEYEFGENIKNYEDHMNRMTMYPMEEGAVSAVVGEFFAMTPIIQIHYGQELKYWKNLVSKRPIRDQKWCSF